MTDDIKWGPSGQTVYERTYSRPKPDGSQETWAETVLRVARGNLELVYGPQGTWPDEVIEEYCEIVDHMLDFRIIPAGRHLWATGVKGRQYLMNCWTAGWTEDFADHFTFTFMRLMEGGGVGANYSSKYLRQYGLPRRFLEVHIVCDPEHPDYEDLKAAGLLSEEYTSDWDGAFEVGDSREGWAEALGDFLTTFMTDLPVKHDKRVYDVTYVRPKGSRIKTFGGTASGPQPFAQMMHDIAVVMNRASTRGQHGMTYTTPGHITPLEAMEIDHAIAQCVVSGGNRRSARMAMVDWDDPFVLDFIRCKKDTGSHWTTNISVAIDDEFILLVNKGLQGDGYGEFGTYSRGAHALSVHDAVVEGMLTNGEPGYFNKSLANHGELEEIYATNPCGEITLQEWEACNLGHVNLDAFAPKSSGEWWDIQALQKAHRLMTRMLIRATFADVQDPKSRAIVDKNRRIGVGHMGVQGFLAKSGIRYSDAPTLAGKQRKPLFPELLETLRNTVINAAREYAFELRIPAPIKNTTVAPTGSVAKLPGVSEGIHPIYGRYFIRRIRFSVVSESEWAKVQGFMAEGYNAFPDPDDRSGNTWVVEFPTKDPLVEQVEAMGMDPDHLVESADEIDLIEMLTFQAMYQKHYADNAVSFTVNFPEGSLSQKEAAETLAELLPSLKGTTLMPDGTRPNAPYERITKEQYEAAEAKRIEDAIDLECATGACPIR